MSYTLGTTIDRPLVSPATADQWADPRGRMAQACWAWLHAILTRLTGKAAPGQQLRQRSRGALLASACLWLAAGGGLSATASAPGWALLLLFPAWAMTVHGARVLQVQMIHMASHNTLFGSRERPRPRLNAVVGHLLSVALLTQYFTKYRRAHLHDHHHRHRLSQETDPTVLLLRAVGLRPGLSPAQLWRRLAWALVSPRFHAARVVERIGSHFAGTPLWHRGVILAYLLTLVGGVAAGLWLPILVAWLVPLFPLYEASATLRLAVEHEWPATRVPQTTEEYAELTHAVFCGTAPPPTGLTGVRRAAAWAGWIAAMLGHGLTRWLVLVGDTPAHDYHTLNPQADDWADMELARQEDVDRRVARGERLYTELWGLFAALAYQFEQLSLAAPRGPAGDTPYHCGEAHGSCSTVRGDAGGPAADPCAA